VCPGVQALEWGAAYKFKSCAMIDISTSADSCNGCSGHGTCAANGMCTCESSPTTGFFHGKHCEYENECETDAHCGANGACIDLKDPSGPQKQCFCQVGKFGAVVVSPSGLARRVCNTTSSLTIDKAALATFGSEYARSAAAAGATAPYEVFWQVKGNSIEVAMKGNTTSWIAVGWRSV
jgi:hypothetical protein